jgi:hypothetical protein
MARPDRRRGAAAEVLACGLELHVPRGEIAAPAAIVFDQRK